MSNLKITGYGVLLSILEIDNDQAEKLASTKSVSTDDANDMLMDAENYHFGIDSSATVYLDEKNIGSIAALVQSGNLNYDPKNGTDLESISPNIEESKSAILFISQLDGTFIDDEIGTYQADTQFINDFVKNINFDINANSFDLSEWNGKALDNGWYETSIDRIVLFHKSNTHQIQLDI